MSDCGCHADNVKSEAERRVVRWALVLNAGMFVIGGAAGLIAQSSGVLADALDMLADASAYAIALIAIGRPASFKQRAASASGWILAILGVGVVIDAVRRALGESAPDAWIMLPIATLSLLVNATVLRMLHPFRKGEVHLRATWVFTRTDVIANLGVIVAALVVLGTGLRWPDVAIGIAIGLYVIKEAIEILRDSRADRRAASASQSR
jgi:cation diffusion facilitator family transporter